MGRARLGWFATALLAVVLGACTGPSEVSERTSEAPSDGAIRVAAFNFPESRLLAEIYRQALLSEGLPVAPVAELGSREIVAPALEQGRIDLVPEYTGSGLNFLARDSGAADADSRRTHEALVAVARERGLTVAAPAPAQNQNAFAVTSQTADRLDVATLSDLRPVAGDLVFGGPPECPQRPVCLQGLEQHYGLEFERFFSLGRSEHVAAALVGGEIDIGLLFSTDPAIVLNHLVILDDDRALQPAENIVPVVRTAVVDRHGGEMVNTLDRVSAELTTAALARLNSEVQVDGDDPEQVAQRWLRDHGLIP